jgi:3-oxoacyl-[acyl-carrier protein] reductase
VNLGLDGRRFVVGGGSKGLGRAVAEALVAEGAQVLLVSRGADALARTAAELGERAEAHAADLSDSAGIDSVVARVAAEPGGLDGILVNHGGPLAGDALDLSDEQWAAAFQLVLGGPIRLLRALLPHLNDGASILFITSVAARQPIPGLDSSNVLRPGVTALAKCLSRELAPRVRVNTLAPGRFDTERVRWLDERSAEAAGIPLEAQQAKAASAIPLGRYGEPIELGRVAAFLLSPAASYLSGVSLQVDGGLVTAVP